jgi:hypothetical protein
MKIANTMMTFGALTLLSISVVAAQQSQPQPQTRSRTDTSQSGPAVKVAPDAKAKAMNPKPGPSAQKKDDATSIGKGAATHATTPDYVSWAEEIDVDGDGQPEVTDVALDNKTKTIYMANDKTFACANGGTADGEILMAFYGKGNTLGKPVGSGWLVAELDAGECGVPAAGLYGCKFDANGNATQCGAAVVEEADVVITPRQGKGPGGDSKK